jgi:hypothetical protein
MIHQQAEANGSPRTHDDLGTARANTAPARPLSEEFKLGSNFSNLELCTKWSSQLILRED